MFKNYFKTAWRNLGKDKMHSFINVIGLSLGMAVSMLIGLWLYDELSFNKNFQNYDRIAAVIQNVTNNGEVQTWKQVPYPLADELRKNYGGNFRHIAMAVDRGDHLLAFDDKKLKQGGVFFEKEAPEMFSLKMIRGNRMSLDDPSSILLSASASKAFFGDEDPLNKTMKIDNMPPVKVTGVYEDFPHNSEFTDLKFISSSEFFYNNADWLKTLADPWRPNFVEVYVQLSGNADVNSVSGKIKDAKLRKVNAQLAKKKPELFLFPMKQWHLYSDFKDGKNIGGAIRYVWMFGIIGIFVLLLACINFMNLSTAKSEKRAKEVGIRKTLGSQRRQLIFHFFSESLLTTISSFIIALLLVQLSLSFFNEVAGKQVSILWTNSFFWLAILVFIIVTALIAGSYPALYLSSFVPIKVLKGSFKAGRFAAIPRKILVVLQFTVSIIFIIGTIIVYRQIQFAKDRPVGYTRAGLVGIPTMDSSIHEHFGAVKNELTQDGVIASIAEAGSSPVYTSGSSSGFSWPGKDPNLSIDFRTADVSYDYGKTIGWKIVSGRDFSKEFATDSAALILNEAAVNYMSLKDPVGETIQWFDRPFHIIGVVDNMVMGSPYDEAKPTVFNLSAGQGNVVLMKISPATSAKTALTKIEAVFKKFSPEQPFEYQFVDQDYAKKFTDEERIGKLSGVFALLAIVISCLGLFGLTSFVAEQRQKEIGIRKVLGASILSIWELLSKGFASLILISFLVAIPLSYYYMHNWLQHYDYRIELSWWIFGLAALIAFVIALATISVQTIKAATANPVKSLRTE